VVVTVQKIISLFQRNYKGDWKVRDEIVPGAEWVRDGEGVATRKYDGTCCLVRDGKLFKRYEIKPESEQPAGFEPANEVDERTGKQQGWVPVTDAPEDKWHREAFMKGKNIPFSDGTYELLGPRIQGNPEKYTEHLLLPHSQATILLDAPRDFTGLKAYFASNDIEGIVWHHPDGRMVKIKAKDFGIKRPR
jgi:hypothetical protein